MGDALREVTVNGVRYFQASDVERWHRGNVARAEEWDALSERVAELEDALRWIQEFAAGTNQHGIVHTGFTHVERRARAALEGRSA